MTTPGGRTLSRDYKDVRRHTTVAAGQAFSGWVGFGAGLALGLAVALGVYLYDRNTGTVADEPVPVATKPPASASATDDAVGDSSGAGTTGPEFDFYDMLPKQEVEVPDTSQKRDGANPAPLPTGEVVLQAGAFKQEGEADRMIARLAMYGVVAKKQRASVDDETWYRVRIGPIATVEELTALKAKLQEAEIQANPVSELDEVPLP